VAGYDPLSSCSLCSSHFYKGTGITGKPTCTACGASKPYVVPIILIGLLIAAFGFIKLSATPLGRGLLPPILIGTSYTQLLSFTRLIRLSWSTSASNVLSITSLTALNISALSQSSCFVSYATSFAVTLGFPLLSGAIMLAAWGVVRLLPPPPATITRSEVNVNDSSGDINSVFDASNDMDSDAASQARLLPPICTWSGLLTRLSMWLRVRDRSKYTVLLWRSWISLLIFSYPFVTWQILQIFDCETLAGESRLRENAAIICQSDEWWSYASFAILGLLLFIIGIPAALVYILLRVAEPERYLTSLASLSPNVRWWLVGQEMWKLAAVLTLRLWLNNPRGQVGIFAALLLLRILAVPFFQPHRERFHNIQEIVLAGCSIVVLIFGLVFYAVSSLSQTQSRVLMAFMVVCIGVMGVVVAYCAYHSAKLAVADAARAKREAKEAAMREAGEMSVELQAQRAIALSVNSQCSSAHSIVSMQRARVVSAATMESMLTRNPAHSAAWDIGATISEEDVSAPITDWEGVDESDAEALDREERRLAALIQLQLQRHSDAALQQAQHEHAAANVAPTAAAGDNGTVGEDMAARINLGQPSDSSSNTFGQ